MDFSFDKLTDGFNSGLVRKVEGLWDKAHDGKPGHIDLHVFTSTGGIKYTNLSNVDNLKAIVPGSGQAANLSSKMRKAALNKRGQHL